MVFRNVRHGLCLLFCSCHLMNGNVVFVKAGKKCEPSWEKDAVRSAANQPLPAATTYYERPLFKGIT